MTSSVERKQYDWRAEAERSFFNTASVVRHSETLKTPAEVTNSNDIALFIKG